MNVTKCSICGSALKDVEFARNYPGFVCRRCDARAVNELGKPARHVSQYPETIRQQREYLEKQGAFLDPGDGGDNPVFIDGHKCVRRYKFGGWVTMLASIYEPWVAEAPERELEHARESDRGDFLKHEKVRQADLKSDCSLFSGKAAVDGVFMGKPRPFCLPREYADESLFAGIREDALEYFRAQGIPWHGGKSGHPSNHLCDSQVCCVNMLYPFARSAKALTRLMLLHFRDMVRPVPMEERGRYLSFEWIGKENYLGEKVRGKERTRGANATSADAAFMYKREDGSRAIVLIEWKYTEWYPGTNIRYSKNGTDRTRIYQCLWEQDDCPLRRDLIADFADFFYEPFYQLMRLQMLAWRMEKAKELKAEHVMLLHVVPSQNLGFQRVTSPGLRRLGKTVKDVWEAIAPPGRFMSLNTGELFAPVSMKHAAEKVDLAEWHSYVSKRYGFFW